MELLDRLEDLETRLLTWGFLDGGFTADELQTRAQAVIDNSPEFATPQSLIERLQDRRLLFPLSGGDDRCRTRYAEAVRLFARLRQIFRADQWEGAPRSSPITVWPSVPAATRRETSPWGRR